MAGALAADEGCTVAVVTSQPLLLHHAAVGGLRLAGGAWAALSPEHVIGEDGPNVAQTHQLLTLALLSHIRGVITNNAMEIGFSMLCRNVDCRYKRVNYAYVTFAVPEMDYLQLNRMFRRNGYAHVDKLIIQLWV